MNEAPRSPALLDADEAARRIIEARRAHGRILLALDFDGTLAPIVPSPEGALLLPAAGRALRRLVEREDTLVGIVSGRGLEDVRARVRESGVYFAGNHGFEIEGPGVRHRLDEAERMRPELRAVAERLRHELAHIDGAEVEDKGVTLSVHYRRIEDADTAARVRRASVSEAERSGLRATHGKRVVELRPAIDWHKGRAVEFLVDALGGADRLYPVFIGDDVTDEDAFRAVQRFGGFAVLVADPADPRESVADARVDSPERLVALLEALADDRDDAGAAASPEREASPR